MVEVAHRLAAGEAIGDIQDVCGTAFMRQGLPEDWREIDSTHLDEPGPKAHHPDPYQAVPACDQQTIRFTPHQRPRQLDRQHTVVRLPSYDQVVNDDVLYAHASRVFHLETNPGNARALVQQHGKRDVSYNFV